MHYLNYRESLSRKRDIDNFPQNIWVYIPDMVEAKRNKTVKSKETKGVKRELNILYDFNKVKYI